MLKTSLLITLLFFVNDLGFIALGSLIKEIVKVFKKIDKKVIVWEILNVLTYNISKIEAVFFSRFHWQQLNKQLWKVKIKVGNEEILFNKEVTQ